MVRMAFVSIGLETSIRDLVSTGGGRPAVAFLGQTFNVAITLLSMSYCLGGMLLPPPTFN